MKLKTFINNASGLWNDVDGNPINAHGGSMLHYNDTYYWYGEIKKGETRKVFNLFWGNYRVDAGGISCYSSKDLLNWKFESVALPADGEDMKSDLHFSKVIERPRVVYNHKTEKFVMWLHVDSRNYLKGRAAMAISDYPTGPFLYIGSENPNRHAARDMTLFQDDDGKVYHFYSSSFNRVLRVCLLGPQYIGHTSQDVPVAIGSYRESPIVFKQGDTYYLITSGSSGWNPNAARYAVAKHPMGPWTPCGNPCRGIDAETAFHCQGTYVFRIPGKSNQFVFMADQWNKKDLKNSTYAWLPLTTHSGSPEIHWADFWPLR